MHDTWIALVPPLCVLVFALVTKRILSSLIMGIVLSALLIADLNPAKTAAIAAKAFLNQLLSIDNAYIFLFLVFMGIIITLVTAIGGTKAYATLIKKKIRSARAAESATVMLSTLLLFDDFFSSITVGSIMRPITDGYSIARAKLAFLVDSMAAPLVVIMPISSWIATLTMQLTKAGVSDRASDNPLVFADPFALYLQIIPFIFYSFILMASVLFIVQMRISYGPMKKHECSGLQEVSTQKDIVPAIDGIEINEHGTLKDFLIPIITLLTTIMITLLKVGDYHLFGGSNSFMKAMQQTNIFFSLFFGSAITLLFTLIYGFAQKKLNIKKLPPIFIEGFKLMSPSIAILLCSWTFSALLINDLKSGNYLASLLVGNIPTALLPCIFFVTSAITSIGIGSSWGTIAIMIPMAVPMALKFLSIQSPALIESIPLLLPILGAVFAGAVAGDHISPLSSTTVMSAMSSGSLLNDHVKTQFGYALPALIASTFAYYLAGKLISQGVIFSLMISLSSGILVCFILLSLLNMLYKNK